MRIIISFIAIMLFLASPLSLSSCYAKDIVWKTTGLGNPSTEIIAGPNGLLYIISGNKINLVDADGKKVLTLNAPGSAKDARPVFGPQGSFFLPGDNSIQEFKANGNTGWQFKVVEGSSKNSPIISSGPLGLLYMPLPTALYAVDQKGDYKWNMPWDSMEANRPWVDTKREILACTGNEQYLYVVYGEKDKGFALAAVDGEGKYAWRYSLGDAKSANLTTTPDGSLYVTVNPGKLDRTSKGKVYCFEAASGGTPRWIFSVSYNDLTAPTVSKHGQLYFCASEYLFVIKTSDGKEAWRQKLLKAETKPAVDESSERVYLGSNDERLLAVTPEGRLAWDLDLEGNVVGRPLPVSGGVLYVVTDKGILYKIKDEPVSQGG